MKTKDNQKYDRLIIAASELLAQDGMSGVSTTKVAKKAGIPQSNLYIYFKNKQVLLEQVFLYHIHKMSVAVDAGVDDDLPLVNQIEQSTRALFEFAYSNLDSIDAIEAIVNEPQTKRLAMSKLNDEVNVKVQKRLETGLTTHTFRTIDLNTLRYFLTEPIYQYARRLKQKQPNDQVVSLDQLITMIMAAVLDPTVFATWQASQTQ